MNNIFKKKYNYMFWITFQLFWGVIVSKFLKIKIDE